MANLKLQYNRITQLNPKIEILTRYYYKQAS